MTRSEFKPRPSARKGQAGKEPAVYRKKIYTHDTGDETVTIVAEPSKGTRLKIVRSAPNYEVFELWPQAKSKNKKKLADFRLYTIRKTKPQAENEFRSPTTSQATPSAYEPNARARAILRGVDIAEADLVKAGGSFELPDVQTAMRGVSRQSIEKRVREKSLLSVPGPSNRRRYPTVQFNDDGTVVRGLQEVLKALDFESPWAALNYLVNPDDRLNNERPIDLLRRGEVELVLESARRVGEQGA